MKEAVVLCCRRFGKSYLGCLLALERALRNPRRVIRIIGPEIKQTEMIVDYNMAKLTEDLNRLGLKGLVERVKSEKLYKVGESAIFLGGFDSQEDSLRGGEADEILIEETGSSDPEQYHYQMRSVLKPQLLKTRGRLIHLTTLPAIPDHPFETETIPQAQLEGSFYSYTIYDDPLATPEIIQDAIKDCGGTHTPEFRREYLNESVRDESIVIIPHFDEKTCVKQLRLPSHMFAQVTIDWGGVRDMTVALLHYYDWVKDRLCFYDERIFQPNTETGKIVAACREMEEQVEKIHLRHADVPGQLVVDLKEAHNYEIATPPKDEWRVAVNNLALGFSQNKIEIDPRCKILIQACRSGRFNKTRTDFERTKALGHCDAIAAAMYANRVQTREIPYSKTVSIHGNYMPTLVKPEKEIQVISSKRFGRFK